MKKREANDLTITFKQRSSTHGDFEENALIAMDIRNCMRGTDHWKEMPWQQQLCLDEIALKIARILSGGSELKEHWHDIQGYAKLGEDACST